jgi:hypothetical protein
VLKTQESKIRAVTEIREPKEEDVLELLFLSKRFYKKAGFEVTGKFDQKKALPLLEGVVQNESYFKKVVIVDGEITGAVAFALSDNPFSNTKIGTEVFFWLEEGLNAAHTFLRLLRMYEKWCKAQNCTVYKFGVIPSDNSDKLERTLVKLGFSKAETAYMKEI